MLYEILCDKFKQERIVFNSKLNTILGDDVGSNSIGKSTILMIIDFVFGGKDYIEKLRDVHTNIGPHIIKFSFDFHGIKYYFLRKTINPDFVWKCDSTFDPKEEISITNYCKFLKEEYSIQLDNISFRDIVGRYSRIYGKENLNEKKPLDVVPNEKSGVPINALLKLFNMYDDIKESELDLKDKKDEFKAYKDAQKHNFIASITKKEYKSNLKEQERLTNEMDKLTGDFNTGLLELDSLQSEEVLELKRKLSFYRRRRNKLKSELEMLEYNSVKSNIIKKEKYQALVDYFPNVNIEKIDKIDNFHQTISSALKEEIRIKRKDTFKLIEISEKEINELEKSIKDLIDEPKVSNVVLKKYANLQKQLERISTENLSLDQYSNLQQKEKDAKLNRIKLRSEVLLELQNDINKKLESINNYIYDNKKKPPKIDFDDNKYTFQTIDDNGTGNNHKSLIIFDLSILEMTVLPILIHDSVVLKQIQDDAIEKLLLKYLSEPKQTFISLDKKIAYTKESQRLLKENKVLELGKNGDELFGFSWGQKESNETLHNKHLE